MKLIPDTIDLSKYVKTPDFAAKVRKASDFVAQVKAELAPRELQMGPRYPTIMSGKVRDRIEFRPGEVTCWAGYNGHRKSTYTSQVALDLCVQQQRVLIISLEMEPATTMARMTRQALGSGYPNARDIEGFNRWTDDRLWLFDFVGELSATAAMGLCRYFAEELRGQHVFIDSMMKVCASEESLDEQKQFITTLCRIAAETGLHLHLVAHCRKPNTGDEAKAPTKYDIKGTGSISDQAHNVFMVWQNKAKKEKLERNPHDMAALEEPDAVVSLEKQRNGEWEGKLQFWFHGPSMRFCDDRISGVKAYDLPTVSPARAHFGGAA